MNRRGFSRIFIAVMLAGGALHLRAQNLILNPSFENTSSCPFGISDFDLCVNWSSPFINLLTDTCSTSDLYNVCASEVPASIMGNEPARTGNGYAGIIAYEGFPNILQPCGSLFGSGWREYVQGELSAPMIAGQVYCISFYLSLADNVQWGTDDLGVYLSAVQLAVNCATVGNSSALQPLGYTPQLQWTGGAITAANGWTKLQWSYTATGGEKFITIGNFKDDANTSYVCSNAGAFNPYAYYFIDDVEVIQTVVCCPVITISEASRSNVSCFGASDGAITVAAADGASPYSYSWSNGTIGATVSNLAAGSYGVTAVDASGCSAIGTFVMTQPAVLTLAALPSSTGCGTSLTASPSGGTGPFSYSWSNGATTATISNLATGTYSVTARDDNNCSAVDSANVTQSGGFTINSSSTEPNCGACDGTISVTPVGGTPPFAYSWSSGQTTPTISSLCAGTYAVTISEDTSSSGSNVFWSENFTSGGTAWTLNINGPGTNDVDANQWVINAASDCSPCPSTGSGGNYLHVTCGSGLPCISSAGDCTYNEGVPFFSNAATDKYVTSPNISTIGKTGITLAFWYMCAGEAGADYGLVRLSDNGGATWNELPAQYSGTSSCTQQTINIPAQYENLADFRLGFRWVNDNNANGNDPPFMIDDIELSAAASNAACSATATVSISSANSPVVALVSKTDVKCFADDDGSINITVSGGSLPYSYSWSNGAVTQNISGLDGGNYFVIVTDSATCAGTLSVDISEPVSALAFSGIVTDAGCGTPNGSIALTTGGGTAPYSYSWSNGAITQNLTNIAAGSYVVTVTDNNLCTEMDSFTVNAPGSFTITLVADSALCAGSSDGSVASAVSGGNAPFQYSWSTGAATSGISNVPKGTYSVTVTDFTNCSVADTATVEAPQVITAIASITKVLCQGGNNGGIKLIPFGGTPDYTALWSNGDSGLTLTGLAPGVYTATITDANDCTADTTINLTAASVYEVETSVTNATCGGSSSGSAQANIINGTTPPYTFNWSTGDSLPNITNLAPGAYTVTVSDSLNCLRNATAEVGIGSGMMIEDSVKPVSCPQSRDGAVIVTVIGGAEPFVYSWSNGASTAANVNIGAGTYYVTVTDDDDCVGTDTALVWVDTLGNAECDTLVIFDVFTPNGDGANDRWVVDGLDNYSENELQIFNRWGSLVFEAKPYLNNWDGRSKKDELLPAATYYYILKLNDANNSVYSGTVTLIR